jgi:hypothetical protein
MQPMAPLDPFDPETLACGFSSREVEVQDGFFHDMYFLKWGLRKAHNWGSFAPFP